MEYTHIGRILRSRKVDEAPTLRAAAGLARHLRIHDIAAKLRAMSCDSEEIQCKKYERNDRKEDTSYSCESETGKICTERIE